MSALPPLQVRKGKQGTHALACESLHDTLCLWTHREVHQRLDVLH